MAPENREFFKRMLVPYYWIYGMGKDAVANPRPLMPLKDSIIRAAMGVPTRHMKIATKRWEAKGWL